MATGDLIAQTNVANGRQVVLTFEALTAAGITAFEAGKGGTINLTREAYSGTTLTTVADSMALIFVSAADNAGNAEVTCEVEGGYIHNDDTSVTVDVDAGLVNDGTNSSNAAIGASITNSSTRDYPKCVGRIVGVLDASTTLLMPDSAITSVFYVEVIGAGGYPDPSGSGHCIAAAEITVTDSDTPTPTAQTKSATSLSRSPYHPQRFYDELVTQNVIPSNPFTANGGGSGVFRVGPFDPTDFVDGTLTVDLTVYPRIGDADSLRTEQWTMYNDAGGSLTTTDYYVDSRATIAVTGGAGTFTVGERIVQTTSGAEGVFRSEAGGVMSFSQITSTDFDNTNTITGQASGATRTANGTPSYNGDDTAAGTTGAPYRRIQKAYSNAQAGTTGIKYRIFLKGDTTDVNYYGSGNDVGTNNTVSVWTEVHPDTSLDKTDIVMIAGGFGADFGNTFHHLNKLKLDDITVWHSYKGEGSASNLLLEGRSTLQTQIWLDNVTAGRADGKEIPGTQSTLFYYNQWITSNGVWITNTRFGDWHQLGMTVQMSARNCYMPDTSVDMLQARDGFVMELLGHNNEEVATGGHHDAFQIQDETEDNTLLYNLGFLEAHDGQILFHQKGKAIGVVNVLGLSHDSNASSPGQSGIGGGDPGTTLFTDMFVWNICLPQNRYNCDATVLADENVNSYFVNGIVGRHGTPTDDEDKRLHRVRRIHVCDTTSYIADHGPKTSTGQPAWENGVDATTNSSSASRDYRPTANDASSVIGGVLAKDIGFTFDLVGRAVPLDGTAVPGPLQLAGAADDVASVVIPVFSQNFTLV